MAAAAINRQKQRRKSPGYLERTIQIIAVDVSPQALQKATELGATDTILASKNPKEQARVRHQVKALTSGGHGVDISIDAAGFTATCENAVHSTRPQGRMIQVGLPIDTHSQPPSVPMGIVAGKELELVGSHGFAATDLPDILQWVSDGLIDPSRLVERHVSLEQGAQAIQDMDHGSPIGIIVVTEFQCPSAKAPPTSRM
jgi:alcohol dehydrogenase